MMTTREKKMHAKTCPLCGGSWLQEEVPDKADSDGRTPPWIQPGFVSTAGSALNWNTSGDVTYSGGKK